MTTTPEAPSRPSTPARAAWVVVVVVGLIGLVTDLALSASDYYPHAAVPAHAYGENPHGSGGALARVIDTLSYFTVWSNIVVVVAFAAILKAGARRSRVHGVLLIDALVMITVTAIVYAVVLAPDQDPHGWALFTNTIEHQLTPMLAVVVWLIWGPRGVFNRKTLAGFIVIPAIWIIYMLIRGAVINAYPYPFVNVADHGYGYVAISLTCILLFGLALAAIFWTIDAATSRVRARRAASKPQRVRHGVRLSVLGATRHRTYVGYVVHARTRGS